MSIIARFKLAPQFEKGYAQFNPVDWRQDFLDRLIMLERFSDEVVKPKPESNYSSQSQQTQITQWTDQNSKQIHVARRQARENECDQDAIGLSFTSDWLRKWREIFNQSQSEVKQSQSETRSTFDTQLKIAPFTSEWLAGVAHFWSNNRYYSTNHFNNKQSYPF